MRESISKFKTNLKVTNASQEVDHAKDEELKFSGVNFDYLAVRKLT